MLATGTRKRFCTMLCTTTRATFNTIESYGNLSGLDFHQKVSSKMAKLIIDEIGYFVDGQKLEPGMTIRRYDEIAGEWYEGAVRQVSSYHYETGERITGLSLVVGGYAPSPLQEGDTIEIVSKAELYNREMDERNRIIAENREKPWLPFHDGE